MNIYGPTMPKLAEPASILLHDKSSSHSENPISLLFHVLSGPRQMIMNPINVVPIARLGTP
jgi:hypothetical protein